MKPLKRNTRKQPLEPQNQVAPQQTTQDPAIQHLFRGSTKVEPLPNNNNNNNNFYANSQNSQSMDSVNSLNNRQSKQTTPPSVKSSPDKANRTASEMSLVQDVNNMQVNNQAVNFQPPKLPENNVKFQMPNGKMQTPEKQKKKSTNKKERSGVSFSCFYKMGNINFFLQ